ncbi:hypothetical protein [Ligilactobacillus salivarius]|uniref:hypothetical protein n=1 Tax=Ligilactobacillus salivarius TaxID=1624 RepID=UPI00365691F8
MNKNIKNMLAELKREFPGVYEAPHQGLYIFVCSMDKVYEDETKADFDELEIDEVDIVYRGDEIKIYPDLRFKCEFHAKSVKYENLDVITKAIAIIGKHLGKIG